MADFCYSKLKTNDNVFIYGKIDNNKEIEIEKVQLISWIKSNKKEINKY